MNERIVVLGSNSFSGSHFVCQALQQGERVLGISRSPQPNSVFLPYAATSLSSFSFYQLDLNHDLDRIYSTIEDFHPDYVVNFAAQGMVGESWRAPEQWLMTNTVSAVMLHDRLRELRTLKKFVQISTPEVYGNCRGDVVENTHYRPSSPYAVSKAAVDMSLRTFYDTYRFPVVFTRAANVYGPGQQLYRIIPRTILYFLTQRKLQLHGGGHSVRSFIHINDVVEGTMNVMRQADPGCIYHFSSLRYISIRSLVELIAIQLGVSFHENVEMVSDRLGKDQAYQLNSGKARIELKWQDMISLEQGVEECIGWVRDNLEILVKLPLNYIHKP